MVGAGDHLCSIEQILKEENLLIKFLETYRNVELPVCLYGVGGG